MVYLRIKRLSNPKERFFQLALETHFEGKKRGFYSK
jgi:hypothetical protein